MSNFQVFCLMAYFYESGVRVARLLRERKIIRNKFHVLGGSCIFAPKFIGFN